MQNFLLNKYKTSQKKNVNLTKHNSLKVPSSSASIPTLRNIHFLSHIHHF